MTQKRRRLPAMVAPGVMLALTCMVTGCGAGLAAPAAQGGAATPALHGGASASATVSAAASASAPAAGGPHDPQGIASGEPHGPTPAPTHGDPHALGAVSALRMIDPHFGWAVTSAKVLTTGDGGQTWVDVTPPAYPGGGVTAYFLDRSHAWVLAGGTTLFRTADGGHTWHSGALPTNGTGGAFAFTDAQHGWLMISLGAAMFHNEVVVYRTADGGATWTEVDHTGHSGDIPGSLPFSGDKGGISFSDALHGWVTLDVPMNGPKELYRTTDGGKTWALQALPNPQGMDLTQYQMGLPAAPTFFDAEHGVLALRIFGSTNRVTTIVYTTSDGGDTWKPLPPVTSTGVQQPIFVSPHAFWMVDRDSGALQQSLDGGATWTAIAPTTPPPSGLQNYQVAFVDAQVGFAWQFGHPGLWRTTDAGKTWAKL